MTIIEIENSATKQQICEQILRSLPAWFGIEAATQAYITSVAAMPLLAAYNPEGDVLGFLALNFHFGINAEIHVMGVLPSAHRGGIGKKLVEAAAEWTRSKNAKFLSVKTLASSNENADYKKTRDFYEAVGFLKFEEFKNLWGENNPCLEMARPL